MLDQIKNWQTTLAGIAGGFLLALIQYMQAGGVITWEAVLSFLSLAVVGYLSKDAVKTGTTDQPRDQPGKLSS
jgi:hypothetical protein